MRYSEVSYHSYITSMCCRIKYPSMRMHAICILELSDLNLYNTDPKKNQVWMKLLKGQGAEDSFSIFKDNLLKAQEWFLPVCKTQSRQGLAPWGISDWFETQKGQSVWKVKKTTSYPACKEGHVLGTLGQNVESQSSAGVQTSQEYEG